MALYSNLRDYRFGNDTEDIRGAKVYGVEDEKLGEIDDVIFDNRTGDVRYVVVDTGGWLTSKKFVVPSRQLMIREEGDEDFRVNLTKEQVEKLPEYREKDIESEDRWNDYESRYEASWSEGPVLHREGSTHTITPDPAEHISTSGSSSLAGSRDVEIKNATPRRIAQDQPRFGATSDSNDSTRTGNLVGNTELQPVMNEYTGVDAVIQEEPIHGSTKEFNQGEGMRSEEPREGGVKRPPASSDKMDSGRVSVADSGSYNPEGGRRFREFQERLRRDREEILRRRRDNAA